MHWSYVVGALTHQLDFETIQMDEEHLDYIFVIYPYHPACQIAVNKMHHVFDDLSFVGSIVNVPPVAMKFFILLCCVYKCLLTAVVKNGCSCLSYVIVMFSVMFEWGCKYMLKYFCYEFLNKKVKSSGCFIFEFHIYFKNVNIFLGIA